MNSNSTTIETVNADFQKYLETISKQDDIAWYIAAEALEYNNPDAFFSDLASHGCISGLVGWLVRYTDTHKFFDEHYEEIQDLKEEWEDSVWEALMIHGDIKNFLAWFAFEEVAYRMANEWEVY